MEIETHNSVDRTGLQYPDFRHHQLSIFFWLMRKFNREVVRTFFKPDSVERCGPYFFKWTMREKENVNNQLFLFFFFGLNE